MVRKSTLPNGIRLITERLPFTDTASIGFWQDVGSSTEDERTNGLTHFVEHMLFKGAKGLTAYEIARRIDSVGGVMNAFTTREHTCFYANVVAKHVPLALGLLGDMYYGAEFAAREIDREKQVILEEIRMYEDSPEDLVHDRFIRALWPRHPIGYPIVGHEPVIAALDRRKLLDFFNKRYGTDGLVVVVAGKVDHEAVEKQVAAFAPRVSKAPGRLKPLSEPEWTVEAHVKKLEQVHVVLGFPGLSRTDERRYSLYLLNLAFGSSMSSRLYQRVREREGICYSIYSFHTAYRQRGVFGVYCATSQPFLGRVLELVRDELTMLRDRGITADELVLAKEQMKGNILLGKESVEARMNRMALEELYFGKQVPLPEVLKRINRIKLSEVREIVDHVTASGHVAVSTLGPAQHAPVVKRFFNQG